MSAFRGLKLRIAGSMVPAIQRSVADDIDFLVSELLTQAFEYWHSCGWHRYDDREVNCSVQLYRWSQEARRLRRDLALLSIQPESVILTPEMLAGTADASRMRRPDFRVSVHEVGRTIECKRLSLSNDHPRKYVHEGMERFVTGVYNSLSDREYMVGFLQQSLRDDVVEAVNGHVSAHIMMGVNEILVEQPGGNTAHRYVSRHANGARRFSLHHYVVDLT